MISLKHANATSDNINVNKTKINEYLTQKAQALIEAGYSESEVKAKLAELQNAPTIANTKDGTQMVVQATDAKGNAVDFNFYTAHEYTVKNVDANGNVTLINSQDSSQTYTIDQISFKLLMDSVSYSEAPTSLLDKLSNSINNLSNSDFFEKTSGLISGSSMGLATTLALWGSKAAIGALIGGTGLMGGAVAVVAGLAVAGLAGYGVWKGLVWLNGKIKDLLNKLWYSPLSLDINGNGVKTTSEVIDYDIDGDGTLDKINNTEDFVLAFDADGDGIVGEDGKELFGDSTDLDNDGKADGYKNGFEALKALAVKYGLIGENDRVLDEADLKFLQDKVGLRMKNGYLGESYTFEELGITGINLPATDETELIENFDEQGNNLMTQQGATFIINGEEQTYADIWHKKLDE